LNLDPPIKICFLTAVLDNQHAGTERHLLRLVRSLDRQLFDPRLVALQHCPFIDTWSDPEVPVHSIGYNSMYRPRDLLHVLGFAKWLRTERCAIIELHSPEAQLVGCFAAKLAGVPLLISSRRNLGYAYDRKARWQLRVTRSLVDCFLANSQVVVDRISELEGIPAESFRLIHNGVDLDAFEQERTQPLCDEFATAATRSKVVTIAANLRPVKNHAMLLRAARRVVDRLPEVTFALLGTGSEEDALRGLAREYDIVDQVLFLGARVPVAPYLAHSHVGCLTSTSEGFSNAIVEYMAAELPVVATNVGGAAEAIEDGVTGYLVDANDDAALADRLLRLLGDNALRTQLGRQGRQRVEQEFSLHRQLQDHARLYRELLRRRHS
jgi:glycosyltransferase involved in cell wall biosynthesis